MPSILQTTAPATSIEPAQEAACLMPLISLKQSLEELLSEIDDGFTLAPSDRFHFGLVWSEIRPRVLSGDLFEKIFETQDYIQMCLSRLSPLVDTLSNGSDHLFYEEIKEVLSTGTLHPIDEGCGGAYLLMDAQNQPRFVVKPLDEDILCLNNHKLCAYPFIDDLYQVREAIPLYRTVQADALAYEVAEALGIPCITPKTGLAIIEHPAFYDLSNALQGEEKEHFLQMTHMPYKIKLCSVQSFIPDTTTLFTMNSEWMQKCLSDEEISCTIDQEHFEDANVLIWSIYDTDAHAGNFLLPLKKDSEQEHALFKIDNGLSFPEKNIGLVNFLSYLPNAEKSLSLRAQAKIRDFPLSHLIDRMQFYKLEASVQAFKERIEVLQNLAQREGMSLAEINSRLMLLEREGGTSLALSSLSREEVEAYFDTTSLNLETVSLAQEAG